MSSILLPTPNETQLEYYNTIATQSWGKNRSLHFTKQESDTVSQSLPTTITLIIPERVHHVYHAKQDTVFGISVEDDKNHQIKSVIFTDEEINFPLGGSKLEKKKDLKNYKV